MSEFIAGALSGTAQTLSGHPLDTIKVRQQNNASMRGMLWTDYYRGIQFPLLSGTIINSIVFGVYYNTKKNMDSSLLSGFLAGTAGSPVVFAFDLYKTKRQMGYPIKLNMLIRNRGFLATFGRESTAFASYFATYEYLRQNNLNILMSGAIAGLINWTVSYPLDVIRNRQISENISFKEAYQKGYLWRGYSVCAARALLVNSIGFYVYEIVRDQFVAHESVNKKEY